jgi:methyl-accepting chemotaxis protein
MRKNLPVTGNEVPIADDCLIVSRTDLGGVIDYVNKEFIEISGFNESELLGQPHNIIRHPDMPAAAFADLWATLKAGRPWSGIIKNRCKNGDHYWVEALATPLWRQNRVVGYMSVRRHASRERIATAEALYKRLSAGDDSLCLVHGAVKRQRPWTALAERLMKQPFAVRMLALQAVPSLAMLLPGLAALLGLGIGASGVLFGIAGFMSLAALAVAARVARDAVAALRQAEQACRAIAAGEDGRNLDISRSDDIGRVFQGISLMKSQMGFALTDSLRRGEESARIRRALDQATANVMVADVSGTIVYANHAVQKMLKDAEADIKKELPQFNADRVIGESFDRFHKNPRHQQNLLANLTASHKARIEIGNRYFQLVASPIIDDRGTRIGTVVDWSDVAIERKLKSVVDDAVQGRLDRRIDLAGTDGIVRELSSGINSLLDLFEQIMNDLAVMMRALAAGDLTHRIAGRGYAGVFASMRDNTNLTADRLGTVLGQIREAIANINTATQEIAAGNSDLSARTEQQAASLEETASSMEEMNATVKVNADNAAQANQLAVGASDVAARGGSVVEKVVDTMQGISQSSTKISEIIAIIDGIAFQTNILALNAAVEAARAGDMGRGFGVVAAEVRSLAQRSAAAAKEIKDLIQNSTSQVDTGATLVTEAGKTMQEIVTSVKRVADIIGDISASSREQSQGIDQVNRAVTLMDQTTQQNAALVEEAAAAAKSLESQVARLKESVSAFKLKERLHPVDGSGTPAAPAPGRRVRRAA